MTDHCLEESRGLSGGTPQGLPACPPPSAECLERSRGGLSLNHLKAVAVAAMVIDHIAFAFVPDGTLLAILLHSIGKITGPTMFFAAVEGCHHTRNLNRYLLRLAVFALVSWFPFLYFHFGGDLAAIQLMRPNVIYTIFLGVLAVRIRRSPRLCSAWKVLLILLLLILTVPADWGGTGVVIILVFDYYYGNWKHQAFAYCMVVMLDMGVLSLLIHPFFGLFYDHVFQIDWELYAYSVVQVCLQHSLQHTLHPGQMQAPQIIPDGLPRSHQLSLPGNLLSHSSSGRWLHSLLLHRQIRLFRRIQVSRLPLIPLQCMHSSPAHQAHPFS